MKLKQALAVSLITLCATGCIQDEALNVEAAIDGCSGKGIQLAHINHEKKEVTLYVSKNTNIEKQEILFQLADSASISADINDPKDNPPIYNFKEYNNGQDQYQRGFTVISESQTTRTPYQVKLLKAELPHRFTFEELAQTIPFHIIYDEGDLIKNEVIQWTSGNEGYKTSGMAKNPEMYPTVQTDNGKVGKCVKLETRSTGSFGSMVKMPIAAGNLFIGSFDAIKALSNARKATLFGFPFTKEPERLTGFYKFKAGKQMTDEAGKPIAGTDKGDIYAVLYEASQPEFFLDGGNSLTDPSIVLKARIDNTIETEEWTAFDLPFEPQNGKTINQEDLAAGKYKLAIVFSSSVDGAYFKGAVGSTLWVDEVEIKCKQ